jgi:hypothetical protein
MGSRIPHEELEQIARTQLKEFQDMESTLLGGGQTSPNSRLWQVQGAIALYEWIIATPGFDQDDAIEKLVGLPMSVGGHFIAPGHRMVVELGLGYTIRDYNDILEPDENGSTLGDVVVVRETKDHDWEDLFLVVERLTKESGPFPGDDESAIAHIEGEWQVHAGIWTMCPGWAEGVGGEHHKCGDVTARKNGGVPQKEGYHTWRCSVCNKAYKRWVKKADRSVLATAKAAGKPALSLVRRRIKRS